jgi:hypothetical protein
VPPGAANAAVPSGRVANLKVLPWAGFRAAVTYTFDDSQPSQIDHFAELDATAVPMTFYVTSGNSGYPCYEETWKTAARAGHELGNHTVSHCRSDLTGCTAGAPLSTLEAEIDACTRYVETRLGQEEVTTMAYPFGDPGYVAAAASRFFLGRGVRDGTIAPGDATDPMDLPVKAAIGGESASELSSEIDRARAGGRWVVFLFHTLLPAAKDEYAGVDVTSVTHSILHARALGDMWIDTLEHVGAYFRGQKVFEAGADRSSTSWKWELPPHFPKGRFLRVTVDGGRLEQSGRALVWDAHGYYEVALDDGALAWTP